MQDLEYIKALLTGHICETCKNWFCIKKNDPDTKYCDTWVGSLNDLFKDTDYSILFK
jgi:hypothetical protein